MSTGKENYPSIHIHTNTQTHTRLDEYINRNSDWCEVEHSMKPRPKPTKNPRRVMTSRCGCKSCGQGLECAAAIDRMPPHATATADVRLRPSEIAVAPAVGRREAADGRREEVCVGGSDIGWAGQGWAGEARQGRPPPPRRWRVIVNSRLQRAARCEK